MRIERIGLAGCGEPSLEIAISAGKAGCRVTIWDSNGESLRKCVALFSETVENLVSAGTLSKEDRQRLVSGVSFTGELAELGESDLVVECVSEDIALKKGVLSEASGVVSAQTALATSTACFSVTEISGSVKNRERVLGLHFARAPQGVRLVEIVRAEGTSQDVVSMAQEFCARIGKESLVCKDSPGFIANYLFVPYMNQALDAYDHSLATKEDLDTAIRMGLGYPLGPLELIDRMGLNKHLRVTSVLFERLGNSRFAPPAILKRMVDGGKTGGETGKGFYPK